MGPAAAAAIPALEALRERDPDPLVRRIAGVALRGINPSPETPAGP
jgi:hypothetical protein